MKRIVGIGLYLTFLSCNSNPTETPTADVKTESIPVNEFMSHTDTTNGFRMDYPTTWDTTKKDSRIIFMAVENDPDTADKFNESLNLTIMSNEGRTLDAIAEENIKAAKEYYGDVEIKSAKTVNDNGVNFISLSLIQKVKGLKLVNFTVFFTHGDKLYTLSQTAETKKMAKYGSLYQHIINSFSWTSIK